MHVIGLDIGGSKSHAVSWRPDAPLDQRTVEATAGSANLASVGEAEAAAQLDEVLGRLAAQGHGDDTPAVVCAGAAGADTEEGAQRLRLLLARRLPRVHVVVVHDAELILATVGVRAGIALISGTGSVAWGRTHTGARARAGGWGYLLGDEGSGYGIARDAVRHALHRADCGLATDLLTERLVAACGLTHPGQLLDHFYATSNRRYWGRRSGVVFDLAAAGDPAATALVSTAAEDLTRIVQQVYNRLDQPADLPVVLGGGILVNQPVLREALGKALALRGLTDLRVLDREPAHGAVRLACTHLTSTMKEATYDGSAA
jgi:glucosamine kinase